MLLKKKKNITNIILTWQRMEDHKSIFFWYFHCEKIAYEQFNYYMHTLNIIN